MEEKLGFWKTLWTKFFTMFYEDETQWWSSMRFSFIVMMLISNLCFWGIWVAVSIIKQDLVSIPESVITIYILANGLGYGSKLTQKKIEETNQIVEDKK